MKKLLVDLGAIFAVFLCMLNSASAADIGGQNRLVLVQGRALNIYFKGEYKEIKRAEVFYGYGWLDDHNVFVAYQPEGWAEASAITEVIDVQHSRSFSLGEIGGTGESNFDVNVDTKEIVFNGPDGIELMTVDLNNVSNKKLSHRTKVIRKNEPGEESGSWGVFWIDNHTVGYLSGGSKFVKINVSK